MATRESLDEAREASRQCSAALQCLTMLSIEAGCLAVAVESPDKLQGRLPFEEINGRISPLLARWDDAWTVEVRDAIVAANPRQDPFSDAGGWRFSTAHEAAGKLLQSALKIWEAFGGWVDGTEEVGATSIGQELLRAGIVDPPAMFAAIDLEWSNATAQLTIGQGSAATLNHVETAIVNILRESGKRMVTDKILDRLEANGLPSDSRTKAHLASMRRNNHLTNTTDNYGKGYGLPEWS